MSDTIDRSAREGAGGDAGDRVLVVMHVMPEPSRRVLLAAAFDAGAHLFGPRAIEDVVAGAPAGTVLLLLSPPYATAPHSGWSAPLLEVGMERALQTRGVREPAIRILGPVALDSDPVSRAVERWFSALQVTASVTARRLADTQALDHILQGDQLAVLAQPIVPIGAAPLAGWEMFCHGPAGHFLQPPLELLRAARDAGRSAELQRAMARAALAASTVAAGCELIFVNSEPDALRGVVDEVEAWAADGGDPTRLVVEVTEGRPIDDFSSVLYERDRLCGLGARLALDDVGAGYAGIAALAALTPAFIKLDSSLVRRCHGDAWRRGIIAALVVLADRTEARVIGEGVEYEADLDVLTELGVHLVQGYLTGRPRPVERPLDLRGHRVSAAGASSETSARVVPRAGIEPATPGFSDPCSTN